MTLGFAPFFKMCLSCVGQAAPPNTADAAWQANVALVGIVHDVSRVLSERDFRGPVPESLERAEAGFVALVTHPDRTLQQLRSIPADSPFVGLARHSLDRVNR